MTARNRGPSPAATLACVLLLAACTASPATPGTSDGASAAASASMPPSATSGASEEPASASAAPTASTAPIGSWAMTSSFDTDPGSSYVTDVAAWSGGFVAIGSAWNEVFHANGPEMPAVWTSADGEAWEVQPVDLGVENVTLVGIAPRADDRLLLLASSGSGDNPDQQARTSFAWVSDDAVTWEAVELPVPDDAVVDSFDHGPMGYALAAAGAIWFSADGTDWTMTHEGAAGVVAGDEGFVAMVIPEAEGSTSFVSSGDGQTWHPSAAISERVLDVAALGGDWVATGYRDPNTIMVWHSADGLEWAPTLDVNELTGPDGPKTGRGLDENAINGASLAGGAGHAFLTLTNNHCCAQMSWNYGVWTSADGATWSAAVEGDAFVSSVASDGDATPLGGHLRRGEDAAFWIGEP